MNNPTTTNRSFSFDRNDTDVIDTRRHDNFILRRRQLKRGKRRFSTVEIRAYAQAKRMEISELGELCHKISMMDREKRRALAALLDGL